MWRLYKEYLEVIKNRNLIWPQPHKEVLVLNGYFPLVLHKKFREYDSMPGIFIFIQTKNFSIQNCSHPEGLDFGCSLSEKGKHNLTVCLPFLRENAPKDRFSGQNCLMWLWPYLGNSVFLTVIKEWFGNVLFTKNTN